MTRLVEGGSARRTRRGSFKGKEKGVRWKFQQVDEFPCRENRSTDIQRPGCVMLDPLTEVGIGMLMSIVISSRQFVMDILRHGQRRNDEQ